MTKISQSIAVPSKPMPSIKNIQYLILLYFWLLIFEGALRKWVVPQLSAPLLIIRDPVLIGAYFLAVKHRVFPKDIFTKLTVYLAFISFLGGLATVILSDTSLPIVFFGLRTNFLHLPLIFLTPKVFGLDDIKKIGKWILLLAGPMALLMAYQFNSPPISFINQVAGGEGEQISSFFGKIRPPGTFSFITGAVQYFSMVTSFLLYGIVQSKIYSNWLIVSAGIGLVLAVAVSGSRGALVSIGLVVVCLLAVLTVRPQLIAKSYRLLMIAAILGISLNIPSFHEGLNVLNARIETSKVVESSGGGVIGRLSGDFFAPFNSIDQIPPFGYGLGMGTNAATALLTGKVDKFMLSEGEWGRVLMESGSVLGLMYILLRIAIVCWMGWFCLRIASSGNILPLLLFGNCSLLILNGQFGQPTSLGFAVLGGGLCLAACQTDNQRLQLTR